MRKQLPYVSISHNLLDRIFNHPDLTLAGKTIAIYLLRHYDHKTYRIEGISIRRMARDLKCSKITIQNTIKQLQDLDFLTVVSFDKIFHYELPYIHGKIKKQNKFVLDMLYE